jgi:hypothetical protein
LARLYSNENFPLPTVEGLRRLGHNVLTSLEAGRANQKISDSEVLAFAVSEGRALITLNRRHFVRLHDLTPAHRGIIVCTFDANFEAQAARVHAAIADSQSLDGKLVRVNRG